jgi:hypothetical protein
MHAQSTRLPRIGIILAVLVAGLFAAQALPAYADTPAITSLDVSSGTTLGGDTVVITGTGFEDPDVTDVLFGATSAATFTVNSPTQITATTPAHAAGVVDVTVVNDDGTSSTTGSGNDFEFVAPGAPTVTNVSPNGGPITGGTTVTITGTNFVGMDPTGDVTFGGTVAAYIIQGPTTIVATAPAHAAGTVQVQVTNPSGASLNTAADNYTYGAVAPTVTGVNPTGGTIAGGNLVVLTGTGFNGVTGAGGVTFGGTNATSYTVNNDTQITAIAPAHAAGTVNLVVTHPTNGASVNTSADDYTYGNVPAITALAPSSGNIAGGQVVTITGTGFLGITGAAAVKFGTDNATGYTVISDTEIQATAPAHAAGVVDVSVTNGAGTSANTAADNFTYTAGPVITSITPVSGPGAGGTVVVITGSGFTGATAVSFGGTPATTFTVNNGTQITATSPAHTAGTVSIAITTPQGTSVDSAADNFLYGSGPSITSISPTQGPTAGGTTVTITGTGFTGATAVSFGATAATSFTVVNDTTITAVSPVGVNGVVRISVVTPIGTSADTAADNFTYGTGATTTYTLFFRWTLIVWSGKDNANIANAIAGQETPDNPQTNSISGIVTAVFHYNNPQQKFEAWFPGGAGIPGANDISTFELGEPYWIAISQSGQVTWTVLTD